jgi:hypothetical protein
MRLTREEIESWRSLGWKCEETLTPKGREQIGKLCDLALSALKSPEPSNAAPQGVSEAQKTEGTRCATSQSGPAVAAPESSVEMVSVLKPYPAGEREAIQKAIEFTDRHFQSVRCDSEAIADCVRCNAQYLAKILKQLLAASQKEGK